ncbi:Uncharacterised protein [Streptococcus pneumoniae]|nr:Uncharacterised protein [Streptococcus pneumoniae]
MSIVLAVIVTFIMLGVFVVATPPSSEYERKELMRRNN